jgi:hypothetical protein
MSTVTSPVAVLLKAGLLAALVSLAVPQAALAAGTTHSGRYSVSGGLLNARTVDTPLYQTLSTARMCVRIEGSPGSYGWQLRLIWYDKGKNKVLWHRFGHRTRIVCSPRKRLRCHCSPKVYDAITAERLASIHGWWKVHTN